MLSKDGIYDCISEFKWYFRVGPIVGSPSNSNSPELCLIAVASGGGGKVDKTKETIKDLILKCFIKRSNTSKVNHV